MIEGPVQEIDTDGAESFLLPHVLLIQHTHVNENFRSLRARLGLKTDTQPAVALFASSGDRVGENEKSRPRPELFGQSFLEQFVFIVQHRVQTPPADVAISGAVNGVAHSHIIGGNCFRHGSGGAAGAEKATRDLLSRADLGEGAVSFGVVIDALRFLTGIQLFVSHGGVNLKPKGESLKSELERNWLTEA